MKVQPSSSPAAAALADAATPRAAGPAARTTRALSVALLLALVALGLAWELRLAPTGGGALAIKVIPLALLLPGLLKYRLWSYRALSLLVWLYVTEGLVRATSERGAGVPLAVAEVALAVALFAACAVHVRQRLAAGREA